MSPLNSGKLTSSTGELRLIVIVGDRFIPNDAVPYTLGDVAKDWAGKNDAFPKTTPPEKLAWG
jgi:hypothetical protein